MSIDADKCGSAIQYSKTTALSKHEHPASYMKEGILRQYYFAIEESNSNASENS